MNEEQESEKTKRKKKVQEKERARVLHCFVLFMRSEMKRTGFELNLWFKFLCFLFYFFLVLFGGF